MDFLASARGAHRDTALNEITSIFKNTQITRPNKSSSIWSASQNGAAKSGRLNAAVPKPPQQKIPSLRAKKTNKNIS